MIEEINVILQYAQINYFHIILNEIYTCVLDKMAVSIGKWVRQCNALRFALYKSNERWNYVEIHVVYQNDFVFSAEHKWADFSVAISNAQTNCEQTRVTWTQSITPSTGFSGSKYRTNIKNDKHLCINALNHCQPNHHTFLPIKFSINLTWTCI